MQLEVARMVANWLGNVTYGVNAKLALVPRDGSDAAAPVIVTIADETRSFTIAAGRLPKDAALYPLLAVTVKEITYRDSEVPQLSGPADASVSVTIRYAQRQSDQDLGLQDASYTLRAVVMALREFHKDGNAASRTKDSVQIYTCERLTQVPFVQTVDDAWVTGAVEVQYWCRDILPWG